jgi:solute carrier family 25 (mitochondrial carnitine/acylcarnitine transporter), member 20/29
MCVNFERLQPPDVQQPISLCPHNTMLAGSVAGIVGTLLGYPLDTIKSSMQASQGSSAKSTTLAIFRDHGLKGFFIGVSAPLFSLVLLNTMSFTTFSYLCDLLKVPHKNSSIATLSNEKRLVLESRYFLAGSVSGVLASFVSTPFEFMKVQMQLNRGKFKSTTELFLQLPHNEGFIARLFTGFGVNTCRECLFGCVYFGSYENGKSIFQSSFAGAVSIPVAGGLAGATAWTVSYPLDVVKTHIQGRSITGNEVKLGALEVGRQLLATKGLVGLYAGLGPSIARAFVVSASRFSAFEIVMGAVQK